MKTNTAEERKRKFASLEGKTFEDIELTARGDHIAVFRAGRWYGVNEERVALTPEVKERHALAFEIGEHDYNEISRRLLKSLENGALDRVSSRTQEKIRNAVSTLQRKRNQSGTNFHYEGAPFFTEVDPLKTATTLFDGGSFYEGELHLPGAKLPIRIKKYGDPAKFKRGLPIQRFLRRLERDGIIEQKINEPAYIDENNGLVAELHLEGKRLIDILRSMPSDKEKADILAPVVRDYIAMSVRANEYRDLKVDEKDARKLRHSDLEKITDEDTYYLKKQGGIANTLKNKLFGNYVIPSQGNPVDNFMKVFALRAVPHLRNAMLTKNGDLNKSGYGQLGGPHSQIVSRLNDGLSHLVRKEFESRPKYLVNLDANTSQVLMMPDGRKVYSDWDHTYFGLIEEQLAELLLTSSIKEKAQIDKLVKIAHDEFVDLQPTKNFSQDDFDSFRRVVDKKMVEKLLGRAARFKDVARGVEDTEDRKNLDGLADRAYTLAMRKMDEIENDSIEYYKKKDEKSNWNFGGKIAEPQQIRYARKAIQDFSQKYLHVREIETDSGLDEFSDSIGSIISSVQNRTPLEGMKSNYKLSAESIDWKGIKDKVKTVLFLGPILGAITYGGMRGYYQGKADEMKAASMYGGKEISVVDPVTGDNLILSGDGKMEDLPKRNKRDIITWAYEISPSLENKELLIDRFSNQELKTVENTYSENRKMLGDRLEGAIQASGKSNHLDPDLIKAVIYSTGRPFVDERSRVGPMRINPNARFYRDHGYTEMSAIDHDPAENIRAGSEFLYQCVRHNGGKLADTLSEYFNGVYNNQRAMIEKGSQNYAEYREKFKDLGVIERVDNAIATYLYLKGVGKESADKTSK